MNTELRRNELTAMKVTELKALAAEYQFKVTGKKAEIIEQILEFEWDLNDEESQAADDDFDYFERKQQEESNPVWWNLVCEMNIKDGQPFVYEHVADRPLLQQIMLNVCRDLYLDAQRAVKVSNGDKSVKQFGPTFVSKKHNCICMKDAMAKGAVKSAAEKVLSKEQQKKFIVLNTETKHKEFKQAVQVLNKLDDAGLISGKETDKDYAKFYSVNHEEILAFLKTVGCLKK